MNLPFDTVFLADYDPNRPMLHPVYPPEPIMEIAHDLIEQEGMHFYFMGFLYDFRAYAYILDSDMHSTTVQMYLYKQREKVVTLSGTDLLIAIKKIKSPLDYYLERFNMLRISAWGRDYYRYKVLLLLAIIKFNEEGNDCRLGVPVDDKDFKECYRDCWYEYIGDENTDCLGLGLYDLENECFCQLELIDNTPIIKRNYTPEKLISPDINVYIDKELLLLMSDRRYAAQLRVALIKGYL